MNSPDPDSVFEGSWRQVIWLGLRALLALAALVALILGAEMLIDRMEITDWLRERISEPWQIALVLLVYAVVIAIPFAPGIEIGIAVMVLFGQMGAVAAYMATVLGLLLAFAVGRGGSGWLLRPFEHALGFDAELAGRPERERLEALFGSSPLVARLISSRYLAIMLLLNLPGNVLIGGGGGIMVLAGLSRAFSPVLLALAVALAVLPVPLVVYVFGAAILG
ncbi:MAG: hypothetical protein AAFQ51_02385 [Pseudomonadota bacterium]